MEETMKEVKEESLLPSVEDILAKHTKKMPSGDAMFHDYVTDYKSAMKEYGELVRKVTLEVASEEATAKIEHDEDFQWAEIEYHSIISLNDSPKLKVH